MTGWQVGGPDVRLAELVAALSLATDLGMGQPIWHALRACVLATRLGQALGLDAAALGEVYYLALLRRIGCTDDAHALCRLFGDDIAPHARSFALDLGGPREVVADMLRFAGAGQSPWDRARLVAAALSGRRRILAGLFSASCDVAVCLAGQLGFGAATRAALGQVFERRDGRVFPGAPRRRADRPAGADRPGRGGSRGPSPARRRSRRGGHAPAARGGRARSAPGGALLPRSRAAVRRPGGELGLGAGAGRGAGAAAGRRGRAAGRRAGRQRRLRRPEAPHLAGHSRGVAGLVAAAARSQGLPEPDRVAARRAALLHDLGRVGVSNRVWAKPGALTDGERERVCIHPYYTKRVLGR